MRPIVLILLAGTALFPHFALAAEETAGETADAADSAGSGDAEEIIILGRGETRQVQELDSKTLAILAPGTSPLKAIEKLPSVNFQSADPFGAYEWSERVTIRGFNQGQLGYTLDGIPLGDATYGNHNGLHISRAVSPENIGVTRVAQGAGTIGTQSTSNLGGTIEFLTLEPTGEFGVDLNATYGTEDVKRGFLRLNLGTPDGVRGYVSALGFETDKWKGFGIQRNMMFNGKLVIPVGDAKIDAYASYSDRVEQDYQDLSLEMIDRLGYNWDNITDNYALAIQIADIAANRGDTGVTPTNPGAGTVYPTPITTVDDAYFDASGLRKDFIAALGVTTPVADTITLNLKGYYHNNRGQGTWYSPYVASPNGVPISVRTTEYYIDRGGVFGSLDFDVGNHNVVIGGWYEHNDFTQARRFYELASRTDPGRSSRKFMRDPFFTQWEMDFTTDTLQYYVEDRIDIGKATIAIGWKGFSVKNNGEAEVSGGLGTGKIKAVDWFQPHVGAVYRLNDNSELFAGFTQSIRAFASSATGGPYSTTQNGFDAIRNTLKPESSDTYELGLRYNNRTFNGVVGAYYVNFSDRLLSTTTGSGIQGNPSVLQNVGSVRSLGFEAAGDLKLGSGLALFASYSYNDTTYRDDVVNALGNVIAATGGKTVVDTPKHLLRGEFSYDSDTFFGRVGANYISKRYFNYLNDRSVDGRVIVDATIGYRIDVGTAKPIEVQLNATNLFDKRYVATIGSNGFGNSGDNQTLLAGAPQEFYLTVKAGF